jgi:4-hydroxyphenylpyruvate dioxygenase
MRERGVHFLQVPKSYYTDLRERLQHSKVKITEDLDMVGNS